MSYLLEGLAKDIIFIANPRTGSTATAAAILAAGGEKLEDDHHALPERAYNMAHVLVAMTIRSHYDVILSYWQKKGKGYTLELFVDMITASEHPRFPHEGLYKRGMNIVDFLLRYESLEVDLTNLLSLAGAEMTLPPQPESSLTSVRGEFTKNQIAKIRSIWGEEIDFMGYGEEK